MASCCVGTPVDIDHIAVGPAGILVVETKHSDDSWPLGTAASPFMVRRLADAKDQARRNASDVGHHEEFRRAIAEAPVVPVLVLHSAAPAADSLHWLEERGVTIVQG